VTVDADTWALRERDRIIYSTQGLTNRTYNNGYETIPILKVEKATQRMFHSDKGAASYRLDFADGYAISC
jgi:hypothetical protein